MAPFKEENEFEPAQIHVRKDLRILRNSFVVLEFRLPLSKTQWGNDAGQWLPFRDG